LLLLVCLIGGCSNHPKAVRPPADAGASPLRAAPAGPAEIKRRIALLYNQTVERRAGFIAQSKNEVSQRYALDRYQRELADRDAAGRFPKEPDAAGLEKQLSEELAGLSGVTVRATPRPPARRKLPAEQSDIVLAPDDFRGVVDVEIVVPVRGLGALVTAAKSTRRLVVLTGASSVGEGVRVRAEAYWFFDDVAVPRVKVTEPSLAEALREAGIPKDAPGLDAEARDLLTKTEALFAEMRAALPACRRVMALVSESALFRYRLNFYRERFDTRAKVTEAKLLAEAAATKHDQGEER
jgi:hypothetical protein